MFFLSLQEQWSEAHQEKLDLQRARVMEVNRHLSALVESWERGGFPIHMNLAIRHPTNRADQSVISTSNLQPVAYDSSASLYLKQENRQLNEKVFQKNERIAILERERQSLIRELLLRNQRNDDNVNLNESLII